MKFTGSLYNKDLTTKDIAGLLRAKIKANTARGTLGELQPGQLPYNVKVSVRMERFSGGSSIYVTLKEIPADWTVLNPEWIERQSSLDHLSPMPQRYSDQVRGVLDILKEMVAAYRKVDSDMVSDYFNTNFYEHIEVCRELEKADRSRYETRKTAQKLSQLGPELAGVLMTDEEKALMAPVPTGAIHGYQAALDTARATAAKTAPKLSMPYDVMPPAAKPAAEPPATKSSMPYEVLPPIDMLQPKAPANDPDLAEQRRRAYRDEIAEERQQTWRLTGLLSRLLRAAQGTGIDEGLLDEAAKVVQEHPVNKTMRQVVQDMVEGHPDTRYVSTTADITKLTEKRLKAEGYEFPVGCHIEDF